MQPLVRRLHAGQHLLERDCAVAILVKLAEDRTDARLGGLTAVEEATGELGDLLVLELACELVSSW